MLENQPTNQPTNQTNQPNQPNNQQPNLPTITHQEVRHVLTTF